MFADSDNSLYFIDKFTGEKIKSLPTEGALIKNEFINSLAIKDDSLFFLILLDQFIQSIAKILK